MKIAQKLQVKNIWFAWIGLLREWLIKEMAGASTLSFVILIISENLWLTLLFGGTAEELAGLPSLTLRIIRIIGLALLITVTVILTMYWTRIAKKLNKSSWLGVIASPVIFTLGILILIILAFVAKFSGMLSTGDMPMTMDYLVFGSLFCSIFLFPLLHLIALWLLSRSPLKQSSKQTFLPPPAPPQPATREKRLKS